MGLHTNQHMIGCFYFFFVGLADDFSITVVDWRRQQFFFGSRIATPAVIALTFLLDKSALVSYTNDPTGKLSAVSRVLHRIVRARTPTEQQQQPATEPDEKLCG